MTSTYTANNGIEKIETGDQSGTWGETTNTNFDIIDRALNGVGSITLSGTSHTLTTTDGSLTEGMFKVLSLAGSPTGTNTITISPNDQDKLYFVKNASGQSAVFSQGTGANVTIPNGGADIIFADGAGSGAAVSSLFASSVTFGSDITVGDDVIVGDDLTLNSDDAVIGFGADTDIKIIHDPDDGLFFKSVATGDDNPFVLTIQTGETDIAADDKLGVIDFQAPDEGAGTDAILVAAGIEAISEGDFAADSNATSLVFKTGASEAATEKVRITSAGLVGIAATSPSSRLSLGDSTVNSNNTITFGKRVTSAQSNLPLIGHDSNDGTASDLGICATSSAGKINFYTGNDAAGFGNGSNDLRMVVDNIGQVMLTGSTTSFDTTPLHNGLQLYYESDSGLGTIGTRSDGGATELSFHTNTGGGASTEAMRIDSDGAVGIGTTSPSSGVQLDVRGDGVIQINNTDTIQLLASNGGSTLKNVSNNPLIFGTNNTEAMRIDSSGRLLIGTTASVSGHQLRVRNASGTCILGVVAATNFNSTIAFGDPANSTIGKVEYAHNGDEMRFFTNGGERMTISSGGNVAITGALSKGSGSFKIDHPLTSKKDTHHLVHSFIEGPQADLIYRGKVTLSGGAATVNIDTAAGMTEGTFAALCDDVQCFTTNETGWVAIKSSVSGNVLTIEAQDNSCTDTISWLVVGERKDPHMFATEWTDDNGKVIVEPEKSE